ncbi:MAG: hypothetical protein JST93_05180 [Acidobacteria bacterium]|nr:hypothetical protein [Acidobacteriota bacterium]
MTPLPEHDDLARQYLLGRLPEVQREQIGERLFSDEAFYEIVKAVEMDLRDAYARNELSGRDRDDFENHLLRTERQRKSSRVSSVLAKSLPGRAKKPVRRWTQWALVAAAAMAIPAAFYAAYLQQQIRILQRTEVASRMRPASAQSPAVVSLFLPGIVLRGAESLPQLKLPSGEAVVKLEIEVQAPGPLAATVRDATGAELFRQSGLQPVDGAVIVWVSAGSLPLGPLEVRISGNGVDERRRLEVSR